jgi:hypothetical protein
MSGKGRFFKQKINENVAGEVFSALACGLTF